MRQNISSDLFNKKQVVVAGKKQALRVVSPIENMVNMTGFKFHGLIRNWLLQITTLTQIRQVLQVLNSKGFT